MVVNVTARLNRGRATFYFLILFVTQHCRYPCIPPSFQS
jgi:hypothetical protein